MRLLGNTKKTYMSRTSFTIHRWALCSSPSGCSRNSLPGQGAQSIRTIGGAYTERFRALFMAFKEGFMRVFQLFLCLSCCLLLV